MQTHMITQECSTANKYSHTLWTLFLEEQQRSEHTLLYLAMFQIYLKSFWKKKNIHTLRQTLLRALQTVIYHKKKSKAMHMLLICNIHSICGQAMSRSKALKCALLL